MCQGVSKSFAFQKKRCGLKCGAYPLLSGAGQLDSALQLSGQVIASHGTSGYPELHRQLGLIYELKGDGENAAAAYRHYFALMPGAPDKARIEKRLARYFNPSAGKKR